MSSGPTSKYREGDEPIPGSGYRLVRLLGIGGFGEVWEAVDRRKMKAALKIISLKENTGAPELASLRIVRQLNNSYLNRMLGYWVRDVYGKFLDEETIENQLLSSSRHSVGLGNRTSEFVQPVELFIALGLCEKTLEERLDECRQSRNEGIPPKELMRYMEGIGEGLTYLHEHVTPEGVPNPIFHRDIKPKNLMILGRQVQICDFGLIKTESDLQKTSSFQGFMSPFYTAPEIFANYADYCVGSDLYSLAITYFELRTGFYPFDEKTSAELKSSSPAAVKFNRLMMTHIEGRLDFRRLPNGERQVLERATRVKSSERYASIEEFIEALKTAVGGSQQALPTTTEFVADPSGTIQVPQPDGAAATRDTTPEKQSNSTKRVAPPRPRKLLRRLAAAVSFLGLIGAAAFVFQTLPPTPGPLPPTPPVLDLKSQLAQLREQRRYAEAADLLQLNSGQLDGPQTVDAEWTKIYDLWLEQIQDLSRLQPHEALLQCKALREKTPYANDLKVVVQTARLLLLNDGVPGLSQFLTENQLPDPDQETKFAPTIQRLRFLAEGDEVAPTDGQEFVPWATKLRNVRDELPSADLENHAGNREWELIENRWERARARVEEWAVTCDPALVPAWRSVGENEFADARGFLVRMSVVRRLLADEADLAEAQRLLEESRSQLSQVGLEGKSKWESMQRCLTWRKIDSSPVDAEAMIAEFRDPLLAGSLLTALEKRISSDAKQNSPLLIVTRQLESDPAKFRFNEEQTQKLNAAYGRLLVPEVRQRLLDADLNTPEVWSVLKADCRRLLDGSGPRDESMTWIEACELEAQYRLGMPTSPLDLTDDLAKAHPYAAFVQALVLGSVANGPARDEMMRRWQDVYTTSKSDDAGSAASNWERTVVDKPFRKQEAARAFADAAGRLRANWPTTGVLGLAATLNRAYPADKVELAAEYFANAKRLNPQLAWSEAETINAGINQFVHRHFADAAQTLEPLVATSSTQKLDPDRYWGAVAFVLSYLGSDPPGRERMPDARVRSLHAAREIILTFSDNRNIKTSQVVALDQELLFPLWSASPKNPSVEESKERREFCLAYGKFIERYRGAKWQRSGPAADWNDIDYLAKIFGEAYDLAATDEEFRARCCLRLGENELNRIPLDLVKARKYADEAVKLFPRTTNLALVGRCQLHEARLEAAAGKRGKAFQEASRNLEQAVADAEGDPNQQFDRVKSLIYLSMSKLEEANYANFFMDQPNEVLVPLFDAAVRHAELAAELGSPSQRRDALLALGNACEDLAWICHVDMQANFTKACLTFHKAAEESFDHPDVLTSKARCYYRCAWESAPLTDEEIAKIAEELALKDRKLIDPSREGLTAVAEECLLQALLLTAGDPNLETLRFAPVLAKLRASQADKPAEVEANLNKVEEYCRRGLEAALVKKDTNEFFHHANELLDVARRQYLATAQIADRSQTAAAKLLKSVDEVQQRMTEALPELRSTAYHEPRLTYLMLSGSATGLIAGFRPSQQFAADEQEILKKMRSELDKARSVDEYTTSYRDLSLNALIRIVMLLKSAHETTIRKKSTYPLSEQTVVELLAWSQRTAERLADAKALVPIKDQATAYYCLYESLYTTAANGPKQRSEPEMNAVYRQAFDALDRSLALTLERGLTERSYSDEQSRCLKYCDLLGKYVIPKHSDPAFQFTDEERIAFLEKGLKVVDLTRRIVEAMQSRTSSQSLRDEMDRVFDVLNRWEQQAIQPALDALKPVAATATKD